MRGSFVLVLALLTGCDGIYDNSYQRPATLQFYSDPASLTVPQSVPVNTSFDVTFRAYGGGCVERARNTVRVAAGEVRIWSWQRVIDPGPNGACTAELRIESHTVTLSLAQEGPVRVRVFGRKEPGGDPLVLEAAVMVTR